MTADCSAYNDGLVHGSDHAPLVVFSNLLRVVLSNRSRTSTLTLVGINQEIMVVSAIGGTKEGCLTLVPGSGHLKNSTVVIKR